MKLSLSKFMGQPLDSSMQQQSIAMNQMANNPNPESQQPSPGQGPASKGPHSYKALEKMPGQYRTAGQTRALQKTQVS